MALPYPKFDIPSLVECMCCASKLGPIQHLLPQCTTEELIELRNELRKHHMHPYIDRQFKELLNEI